MKPTFHQFEIGPMKNFCYFIGSDPSSEVLVVDPGWEHEKIIKEAERLGRKISGVLLTHHHYDHVQDVDNLLEKVDIPVYMLKEEARFSGFQCQNLQLIENQDRIPVAGVEVEVLHTPGHTIGSVSYRVGDILVTGDTLFINGCGRCDLPSGSAETLYKTLHKLVESLPGHTVVLPGHDYGPVQTDSIANQIQTNPYLQFQSLEDFVRNRIKPRL